MEIATKTKTKIKHLTKNTVLYCSSDVELAHCLHCFKCDIADAKFCANRFSCFGVLTPQFFHSP